MDSTTATQLEALKQCSIFAQVAFEKQLETIIRRGKFTREVYDGLPSRCKSRAATYIAFRRRYEGEENVITLQWDYFKQLFGCIFVLLWHILCCVLSTMMPDNTTIQYGAVNPHLKLEIVVYNLIGKLHNHYTQEIIA